MKVAVKLCATVFCLGLLCAALSRSARADEWNKKTIVTFSGPVEVAGTRLDAGTYVFKLADSESNRHIVRIFNQDENQLIATVMAIPDYRLAPTDKTAIKFSETSNGTTTSGTLPASGVPIKEWFYPGDNFGQEFPVKVHPAAATTTESEPTPAPLTQAPEEKPVETAEAQPPQPQPQAQESAPPQTEHPAAPASGETETPAKLPKTASSTPLIGLIGLLSLAITASLGVISKRRV